MAAGGSWNSTFAKGCRFKRIVCEHEILARGYLWMLQNSPRVPEAVREYYRQWGWPKDEFLENDHFPPQLYIREARRMVADVVMTEHHVTARETARDPSAWACGGYTTDEGFVRNEGNVQVGGFAPY